MTYRLLADLVVLLHALFVVFVVAGGLLVWRWRWVAWLHVPAAAWGAAIELGGWVCPLTPLENHFRARAGLAGYRGGFIEHYLLPALYPEGLTALKQIALGALVVGINLLVYGVLVRRLLKGSP
jgi:hypothetical protein